MGWQWRSTELEAIAAGPPQSVLLAKQAESASQLAYLKSENERLQAEVENIQKALQQAESRPLVVLADVHIADMKALGLKTPVSDLLANLELRTDLIPFNGVAGRKMRFQPWLVNRHWVVAGVGDGHVGGWVILKYKVDGDGQIQWTVLDSARE